MKIRFYHWWIYKLYYWFWTPILKTRPRMVQGQMDWMKKWLLSQPTQTMDQKYGDGSDHLVCQKCGQCAECGDCEIFGCGKKP